MPFRVTPLQSAIRHLQLAICFGVAALWKHKHLAHQLWQLLFGRPIAKFPAICLGQLQEGRKVLTKKKEKHSAKLTCNQMQSNRAEGNKISCFRVWFSECVCFIFGFCSGCFQFCWPKNVVANQIACRPKSAYESALERDNDSTNIWGGGGGGRSGNSGSSGGSGGGSEDAPTPKKPNNYNNKMSRIATRRAKPNEAIEFILLLPQLWV